jgi:hypothetical protein
MPRAAGKKTRIVALLRAAVEPLSISELARAASCSEVYAWGVLRELGESVEVSGRSRTGAKLFVWAGGEDGAPALVQPDPADESPPALDDVVRVVEARRVSESEVELGLRRIGDGAMFRARVRSRAS